jgi:hypothetical protein
MEFNLQQRENIFLRQRTKFPLQLVKKFDSRTWNGSSMRQIIRLHIAVGTIMSGVLHPVFTGRHLNKEKILQVEEKSHKSMRPQEKQVRT